MSAPTNVVGGHNVTFKSTLPKTLTKKDVLRLRMEQRGLRDLQDQKIDQLTEQVRSMGECFEIARRKREALKFQYKERRAEVVDRIAKTRVDIDAHFTLLHTGLKDFATDWLGTRQDAKREWEDTLADRAEEIEQSFGKIRERNANLDARVETERVECREAVESSAASILRRLAEIRGKIAVTGKERVDNEIKYEIKFKQDFGKLKRVLNRETVFREAECKQGVEAMIDFYEKLHVRETQIEQDVRVVYKDDLTVDLKVEEVDRVWSQDEVVRDAASFLDQFKANIQEDIENSRQRTAGRRKMIQDGLKK